MTKITVSNESGSVEVIISAQRLLPNSLGQYLDNDTDALAVTIAIANALKRLEES